MTILQWNPCHGVQEIYKYSRGINGLSYMHSCVTFLFECLLVYVTMSSEFLLDVQKWKEDFGYFKDALYHFKRIGQVVFKNNKVMFNY